MAVDQGAPQLPSLAVGDRLDAKRTQFGQRRNDRRLGVGGRGPGRRRHHIADVVLPLRRQRQDAVALQRLQHPEAGPNPVVALGRRPAEMLADRLSQLVAAVVGQQRHGLLDVGDLLTVQAAARKGARLEGDDPLVHGRSPKLSDNSVHIAGRLSRTLLKSVARHAKVTSCQCLAGCRKIPSERQLYPNAIGLHPGPACRRNACRRDRRRPSPPGPRAASRPRAGPSPP